jgi:hypothetical protein
MFEMITGTSAAASALSKYVDSLAGHKISISLRKIFPMNSEIFAPYPDFLAFSFCIFIIRKVYFKNIFNKALS